MQGDPVATVAHHFREEGNYEIDGRDVTRNVLRMLFLHWLERALDAVFESDVFGVRAQLEAARRRDDDWYCRTFAPALA